MPDASRHVLAECNVYKQLEKPVVLGLPIGAALGPSAPQ